MVELDKKLIGGRIKMMREALGLSQKQFSGEVKLSQSAMSQFEDGIRLPSTTAIQKIADRLGVPVSDLLAPGTGTSDSEKELLIKMLADRLRHLPKDQVVMLNRFVQEFTPAQPRPQHDVVQTKQIEGETGGGEKRGEQE